MRNWNDIAREWKAREETIPEQRRRLEAIACGRCDCLAVADHAAVGHLLRTAEDLAAEVIRLAQKLDRPRFVLDLAEDSALPGLDLSEIQDVIDMATPGPFTVRSHGMGIELTAADGRRVARFVNGIRIGDLTLFGKARAWLQALVTEVRGVRNRKEIE